MKNNKKKKQANVNLFKVEVDKIKLSIDVMSSTVKLNANYTTYNLPDFTSTAINRDELLEEYNRMYMKVLDIGVKDLYNRREINLVNAFFAVGAFVDYTRAMPLEPLLLTYKSASLSSKEDGVIMLLEYRNKKVGFDGLYMNIDLCDKSWIDDDDIIFPSECSIAMRKLTNLQVKQLIEYCTAHKPDIFDLIVISEKNPRT